jgi:hypothetical protein
VITGKFEDPVYGFNYIVAGNCSDAEASALVGFDAAEDPTNYGFSLFNEVKKVGLIWIRHIDLTSETHAYIAHECLHMAISVLEHVGVEGPTAEDDEAHAYYLSFLVRNVTNILMEDIL